MVSIEYVKDFLWLPQPHCCPVPVQSCIGFSLTHTALFDAFKANPRHQELTEDTVKEQSDVPSFPIRTGCEMEFYNV